MVQHETVSNLLNIIKKYRVYYGLTYLSKELEVSSVTLSKAIKILESEGHIKVMDIGKSKIVYMSDLKGEEALRILTTRRKYE